MDTMKIYKLFAPWLMIYLKFTFKLGPDSAQMTPVRLGLCANMSNTELDPSEPESDVFWWEREEKLTSQLTRALFSQGIWNQANFNKTPVNYKLSVTKWTWVTDIKYVVFFFHCSIDYKMFYCASGGYNTSNSVLSSGLFWLTVFRIRSNYPQVFLGRVQLSLGPPLV